MRINPFVRTSSTPSRYKIHTLDVFGTEETVILTSTEAYQMVEYGVGPVRDSTTARGDPPDLEGRRDREE